MLIFKKVLTKKLRLNAFFFLKRKILKSVLHHVLQSAHEEAIFGYNITLLKKLSFTQNYLFA